MLQVFTGNAIRKKSDDLGLDKVFFFQTKSINFFLFLHGNICCGYSLSTQ